MDEHTQKLQTYIQSQLGAGQTPDEIAAQLRNAGWQEDLIQLGFHAVQAAVLPTSMQAPSQQHIPQALGQRRGRMRTGWQILKQAVAILRGNRYLLRYLSMTAAWIFSISAIFFVIYWFVGKYTYDHQTGNDNFLGYSLLFVDYVISYFFINLYAAGLTANVLDIFEGRRKPYREYMRIAWSKAVPLLVFSLISATVGILLQFIAERVRFVGWLLAWLLGALWSLGSMFVVPIVVSSDRPSAVRSIGESISFFKRTWGEDVTAKVTVNGPLFILNLAAFGLFFILIWPAVLLGYAGIFALIILYLITITALWVLGSFANSLLNISLFYYATKRQIPPAFSEELLNSVFVKRGRRGFFGLRSKAATS